MPTGQGDSKKSILDGCDGAEAVFSEDFTDFCERTGKAVSDARQGVAHCGHGLGSGAGSYRAGIFSKDDIASPVETILDPPVVADEGEQGFGTGIGA